jgi:hypothetical protein
VTLAFALHPREPELATARDLARSVLATLGRGEAELAMIAAAPTRDLELLPDATVVMPESERLRPSK